MPTHKSARELLIKLVNEDIDDGWTAHDFQDILNKRIDTTLAQLAELVRQEKKNEAGNINWNLACEHIAQKLEGKK